MAKREASEVVSLAKLKAKLLVGSINKQELELQNIRDKFVNKINGYLTTVGHREFGGYIELLNDELQSELEFLSMLQETSDLLNAAFKFDVNETNEIKVKRFEKMYENFPAQKQNELFADWPFGTHEEMETERNKRERRSKKVLESLHYLLYADPMEEMLNLYKI
jgi:hypothetical protein